MPEIEFSMHCEICGNETSRYTSVLGTDVYVECQSCSNKIDELENTVSELEDEISSLKDEIYKLEEAKNEK